MLRSLVVFFCLVPLSAFAQSAPSVGASPAPLDHAAMHAQMMAAAQGAAGPKEGGQSAFAAISEIVALLAADPNTDWTKVDIEALRRHLIDMDNVTLRAEVKEEPVEGGVRFLATGAGPVQDSIRRMTFAHAATMNGAGGWTYAAAQIESGASLTVTAPAADLPKLKALGFIGVLSLGMHHSMHHLMIARGLAPHG